MWRKGSDLIGTMKKKINYDVLDRIPPDKLVELNNKLHEVLCKSIISLFQNFIAGPGILEQQIETARELAELMPDTDAAIEVLEFLESKEVREALVSGAPE